MNKNAVVTGGASGIGQCAVRRLLQDGWSVWCLDNSSASLETLADEIGENSRYHGLICDVSSPKSVADAFTQIASLTNSIDALVHCAGVVRIGALEKLTIEDVDTVFGVNLKGPWLTICQALPMLREGATTTNPARVVIIGSISGIRPKIGSGIYAAAKAAAHVLAQIFAVELAPSGILVNVVAPGSVDTPMMRAANEVSKSGDQSARYKASGESPLGRVAQPHDIVDVVLYLLSDAARYVNGIVLPVDGGTRAAFVKT